MCFVFFADMIKAHPPCVLSVESLLGVCIISRQYFSLFALVTRRELTAVLTDIRTVIDWHRL